MAGSSGWGDTRIDFKGERISYRGQGVKESIRMLRIQLVVRQVFNFAIDRQEEVSKKEGEEVAVSDQVCFDWLFAGKEGITES